MRLPIAPAVFLFTGAIVLACSQADLTAPNEDGFEPAFVVRGGGCPADFVRIRDDDPRFDGAVDMNGDLKICLKFLGVRRKGIPAPSYILVDNNAPLTKKK
jgi:hypothetical protein